MGRMGEQVTDEEVAEMIELADTSGNGGVSFADLETLMLD